MSRAAVVVNPAARGGAGEVAAAVALRLRALYATVDVLATERAGGGVEQARAACAGGASLVVAVGGDGTAREVAQGVAEALGTWDGRRGDAGAVGGGRGLAGAADTAPVPMLIVPAGTGNSVHHALWSDLAWETSLDLLARGAVACRDLDLARIDGHDRAVLLGASAGFLRWTVEATARFPQLSGRELYTQAALSVATTLRPYAGGVLVDGAPLCEGPIALAAVGGAQRRGGSLTVLPRSALDDGVLDVCVLVAADADAAVAQLTAAIQGAHLELPGVHYAQGRSVTLEAFDGPLPFEQDGDPWPGSERALTLSVVPAAVPMVVPRPA